MHDFLLTVLNAPSALLWLYISFMFLKETRIRSDETFIKVLTGLFFTITAILILVTFERLAYPLMSLKVGFLVDSGVSPMTLFWEIVSAIFLVSGIYIAGVIFVRNRSEK